MNAYTQTERSRVLPAIEQRWSPRAFSSREVSDGTLRRLFRAAGLAASSMNEQPWCFVFARRGDGEVHDALAAALNEGNRTWAVDAPVLILAAAKRTFSRGRAEGRDNRHSWYDTGQAMAQAAVQASAMGLQMHQMGGFSPQRAAEAAGLPEGYDVVVMAALGYPGDPEQLPEPLRGRERAPRDRKSLRDFVFHGRFGREAALESTDDFSALSQN
jgi:nitroreductase